MRLRHIHLPASAHQGIFPSYKTAAGVQELLRRRLLAFKDAEAASTSPRAPPQPTLISFTPQPTYTLGRRQTATASPSSSSLSPSEIARLRAPLHTSSPAPQILPALGVVPDAADKGRRGEQQQNAREHVFEPAVLTSPRGGLATYHGPGQVVLWPVMAISGPRPLGYRHFTVRCYSRLLEKTTVSLLRRLFGLSGFTSDDPGVWVRTPAREGEAEEEVRKVSALGIHLRRHVSSLGTAVNLDMPTTSAVAAPEAVPDEEHNPWARFVACGLEGKGVTCVQEELRAAGGAGIPGLDGEIVARAWAEELAREMELDPGSVEWVAGDEVEEIVSRAETDGFVDAVAGDEV